MINKTIEEYKNRLETLLSSVEIELSNKTMRNKIPASYGVYVIYNKNTGKIVYGFIGQL